MQVSGPLRAPDLDPCPGRDDKVGMIQVPQKINSEGRGCCNYWTDSPNVWCNEIIRTDLVNPEKFQYDKFRYQLYAKPRNFDCHKGRCPSAVHDGLAKLSPWEATHPVGRRYVPPHTDVRALQQTMYVPVLPSKAGGERDVTFPMTARTMGQPDVTTACCVPVIPCNPGFKNLTDHIKPTAAEICQYGNMCMDGNLQQRSACDNDLGAPPQFISAPSNVHGGGFTGLPDTFPTVQQRQSIPGWNPREGDPARCAIDRDTMCAAVMDDGTARGVPGAMCMNSSVFKYKDRTERVMRQAQETAEERHRRLHTMYGAYGACLNPKPNIRTQIIRGKDNIVEQGNGFHWDYPKNANRQCFVLSKNTRC